MDGQACLLRGSTGRNRFPPRGNNPALFSSGRHIQRNFGTGKGREHSSDLKTARGEEVMFNSWGTDSQGRENVLDKFLEGNYILTTIRIRCVDEDADACSDGGGDRDPLGGCWVG